MEGFNEGGDLGCGVGLRTILWEWSGMEKIFYFVGIGGWRNSLFVLNLANFIVYWWVKVEMYRIGWESRVVVGHWKWCRRMFVWEEEHVVECCFRKLYFCRWTLMILEGTLIRWKATYQKEFIIFYLRQPDRFGGAQGG
jgi:hypothetical protein